MNRFPLACPMFALLLISPLSVAEPTHETTFEPAPVFEDDDLYSKAKRWEQKPAAKAAEQAAVPVAESKTVAQTPAPSPSAVKTAPALPAPVASSGQTSSESAAASKNPLKDNMPIALLVLAAVGGFVMWRKGAKHTAAARESRPGHVEPSASAAGTGVSRYLKTVVGAATGAAETGVARYLKTVAEATPAAGTETGVARYLKNRT